MPWYRVDDGFPDHPKLEVLERDPVEHALAIAAWTLMGADCARRRTDGRFTEARMRRVLPWPEEQLVRARDALLDPECGLWERDGDVLVFHDWADYQPTKAELEADRRAATERQKRWRENRRRARSGGGEPEGGEGGVDASTNASTTASHDASRDGVTDVRRDPSRVDAPVDGAPSRPVPSRPSLRSETPRVVEVEPEGIEGRARACRVALIGAYRAAWESDPKRDAWVGPSREGQALDVLAAWLAKRRGEPRAIAAELVRAYFASTDAYVLRARWSLGLLSRDPGRYLAPSSEGVEGVVPAAVRAIRGARARDDEDPAVLPGEPSGTGITVAERTLWAEYGERTQRPDRGESDDAHDAVRAIARECARRRCGPSEAARRVVERALGEDPHASWSAIADRVDVYLREPKPLAKAAVG